MANNTVALNYLFEYNQYQYFLVGYLLSKSIISARRKCRPTAVYFIATVAFDTNYLQTLLTEYRNTLSLFMHIFGQILVAILDALQYPT